MSDFIVDKITNRVGDTGTQICGVTTFTGTSGMVIPGGPTEYRGGRGRGIVAGGDNPTYFSSMEFVEIATTGTSTDFGDMLEAKRNMCGASSSTRGVIMGGQISPGNYATKPIEYTIISSGGGSNDFGDLISTHLDGAGVTSDIRGFICGGFNQQNLIEYVTIASTGDATDFADLAEPGRQLNAGCESSTRGIILGGYSGGSGDPHPAPNNATSTIQFFNFASQGDTTKFGELTENVRNVIAVSDKTRGVRMGGYSESVNPAAFIDTIDYITMASEGNATDFGNCLSVVLNGAPVQNRTRGLMMGGAAPGLDTNVIQFITIQTTGNATDFGDLLALRASVPAGMCDINASNS